MRPPNSDSPVRCNVKARWTTPVGCGTLSAVDERATFLPVLSYLREEGSLGRAEDAATNAPKGGANDSGYVFEGVGELER